jgi:hypothetical protein
MNFNQFFHLVFVQILPFLDQPFGRRFFDAEKMSLMRLMVITKLEAANRG